MARDDEKPRGSIKASDRRHKKKLSDKKKGGTIPAGHGMLSCSSSLASQSLESHLTSLTPLI
jgi:hypothetical protein